MDMNCMYCNRTEKIAGLMFDICSLEVSDVFLLKDQTYKGRCVIALREHADEIFELSDETRNKFFAELNQLCKVLADIYKPEKINAAAYGDKMKHFHFHIVPKTTDCLEFGSPFVNAPAEPVLLSDAEYQEAIAKIKAGLGK